MKKSKNSPNERQIQTAFIDEVRWRFPKIADSIFHIPNEGKRSVVGGYLMKRMGLTPGVADILVMVPTKSHHSLWIEFKAGRNKQTPSQLEFQRIAIKRGSRYCVCYTSEEAIALLVDYIKDI